MSACKHLYGRRFCPDCGKQLVLEPVDARFMREQYALWMTRVFRDTVLGLLSRPGHLIRDYLIRDRDLIVKQISYLIFCSGLYIYAQDHFPEARVCDNAQDLACMWFVNNLAKIMLLQSLAICFIVKYLAFRKAPYGFFEILALATYLIAQGQVISILILVGAHFIGKDDVFLPLGLTAKLCYLWLAIGQFFEARGVWEWAKAAGAVVTAAILMMAALVVMFVGAELYYGADDPSAMPAVGAAK